MKLLFGLPLFLGLFHFSLAGAWALERYTPSPAEHNLWQSAANEQTRIEANGTVLDHTAIQRFLEGVVARLWQQAHSDLPPMRIRLLADSRAKAFTYPNGVCYITSGMLLRTRSQDQLAMVIAHEMVHYTQRHTLSAFRSAKSHPSVHDGRENKSNDTTTFKGSMHPFKIAEAEQQADREGLWLITKAGYCADEALDLILEFSTESRHRRADARFKKIDQQSAIPSEAAPCRADDSAIRLYLATIAPALKANAGQALQRGQWDAADTSINRYLSVCPDDPQAHFIKGEILRLCDSGKDQSASIAAYRKAIDLDDNFAPAYQALGVIFFKSGRTGKAKHFFERCLLLSGTGASPYIKRYLQLCNE